MQQHAWAPSIKTVLLAFLAIRTLSAAFNPNVIADCDEVYNYWEPTHYIAYGYGFQTWEYSPAYSLRSYAYILIHSSIAQLLSIFTTDKITVFFGIRTFLAFLCSLCETFFYYGVQKRFGPRVTLLTFFFLLITPGMFISSTAFLPSSFSMYGMLIAFGAWFVQEYALAVTGVAFATIMGWPFCIVVSVPLALDAIYQKGFLRVFAYGAMSLVYFLLPSVLIDYYYYHKVIIAVWNIIKYNVLESHGGPNLYGVEPWSFYFMNSVLNFNGVIALAFLSIPLILVSKYRRNGKLFAYILPFYVWFGLMSRMAHKEERFLFVIYPLICLCGGISLSILEEISTPIISKITPRGVKIVSINRFISFMSSLGCLLILVLSASRITSIHINYSAPLHLYSNFYHEESLKISQVAQTSQKFNQGVNVCVGKEWYRFPSNFFLPTSSYHLQFIESGFTGQLPKPYAKENGTWIIPTDMNDLNKQEMSRYIDIEQCHYLVDLDFPTQKEPHYAQDTENWEVIAEYPFLDAARSDTLFRAFYVPFISSKYTTFNKYYLLRRHNLLVTK